MLVYLYACMLVCLYTCMLVCLYACMLVCLYACILVYFCSLEVEFVCINDGQCLIMGDHWQSLVTICLHFTISSTSTSIFCLYFVNTIYWWSIIIIIIMCYLEHTNGQLTTKVVSMTQRLLYNYAQKLSTWTHIFSRPSASVQFLRIVQPVNIKASWIVLCKKLRKFTSSHLKLF